MTAEARGATPAQRDATARILIGEVSTRRMEPLLIFQSTA